MNDIRLFYCIDLNTDKMNIKTKLTHTCVIAFFELKRNREREEESKFYMKKKEIVDLQ
jgi:hypothetical protein